MHRRRLLFGGLIAGGLALCWRLRRYVLLGGGSMFDRVVFVCCNDAGDYSPGVYLHGADGGPAALDLVRQAAPCMRDKEVGDAAAGLCGYLFKQLGDDVAAGGGLSLYDAPKPGPNKTVDWQAYCSWNVDLVLINVDRGTAECYSSPADPKAPSKSVVKRLSGLRLGG